jgi:signal transduction histidine kinase
MKPDLIASVDLVRQLPAVPSILDVVCKTTGLGFAAVARVTRESWVACEVLDGIDFGLKPGGELRIETTICNEIRDHREIVVINDVSTDAVYTNHHTPALYGFQSYISVPIVLPDGSFFGTLCGIDPHPKDLSKPEITGMFRLFAELIAIHIDARSRLNASEAALAGERAKLLDSQERLTNERERRSDVQRDLAIERIKLVTSEANLRDEREVSELREQFIAVLGHDLRNPLAAMKGGAELLHILEDNPRKRTVVTMMTGSIKRMSDLIDNLLDFARGRLGGGLTLEIEAKSIEPMLVQVIGEVRSAWPDRAIETHFGLECSFKGDHSRLSQLLSNLLANAITHGASDQPIRVHASTTCKGLTLSVANGGVPIPVASMDMLFQPFKRGVKREGQEGLGLGLFISSQIALAHGGSLTVASDTTETVFTLNIPS